MTKAPLPTEKKSKKHRDNIKNATKNFDYTTIADRHLKDGHYKSFEYLGGLKTYPVSLLVSDGWTTVFVRPPTHMLDINFVNSDVLQIHQTNLEIVWCIMFLLL